MTIFSVAGQIHESLIYNLSCGQRIFSTWGFFIGRYSPALVDPLLLVRRKVRRYTIDFVGFPMAVIVEIGTKSVSLLSDGYKRV